MNDAPDAMPAAPAPVRLQKLLARAGVASRRRADELIAQGRVTVDGEVVTRLGTRVPREAVVHVDGSRVIVDDEVRTFAYYKPVGVVTSMSDERGRPCVGDRVPVGASLVHVGRLDIDTEGLLLITNDGTLAHRLAHPSFQVAKTYLADVHGDVAKASVRRLRSGIELEDGAVMADRVRVRQRASGRSLVELSLHEGRNRIVRRMFDAIGHPVHRLVRTQVGPVRLADLSPDELRELRAAELAQLYAAVQL